MAGVGSTKISEEYPFDYDFKSIKQNARKTIADKNAKEIMSISKKLQNAQQQAQNYKGEQLSLELNKEVER